jgi:hypothetical protein
MKPQGVGIPTGRSPARRLALLLIEVLNDALDQKSRRVQPRKLLPRCRKPSRYSHLGTGKGTGKGKGTLGLRETAELEPRCCACRCDEPASLTGSGRGSGRVAAAVGCCRKLTLAAAL